MNERTKELAEQAALLGPTSRVGNAHEAAERFAELVRQDEREACVKLLEDFAKTNMVPAKDTWRMGLIAGANAIRSKHD
jgi:hypothetical protein